jgi:two-component system, sensor histidine kinase and response regulator
VWDVIVNPLHGPRGQVERVVASARDVSEMVELHRRLSETLRLNETFVAAIGHDLRTPLNSIALAADMLYEQAEGTSARGLVARVRTSAQRMRGMIDELYDLARARLGGGISIHVEPAVDLEDAAARVIGELDAQRGARPVVLDVCGNCIGTWDHARIMQVLSNLVGNALRHGSPSEEVRVRLDGSAEQCVRITVENAGEVPADVRPSVFDPFKRGPERARSSEGLGLGLYIARQIVDAHGGSIVLDSGAGRTSLRVELPRRTHVAASAQVAPL